MVSFLLLTDTPDPTVSFLLPSDTPGPTLNLTQTRYLRVLLPTYTTGPARNEYQCQILLRMTKMVTTMITKPLSYTRTEIQ